MSSVIPRIKVPFLESQRDAVCSAIERGYLVNGPHLDTLKQKLAQRFNKKYVVLTANGFSALFLALKAAGVKRTVNTAAASTCFAMVNAIKAAGCDVNYKNLEQETFTTAAPCSEEITLVPDHFGIIAPWLRQDAPKPSGFVIEDACQSFMSREAVETHADIVAVSFYVTKLANGIDGGALLTDDLEIANRANQLVYYGDQYRAESEARFNLKLNNINAAFLLETLKQFSVFSARLHAVTDYLGSVLNSHGIRWLQPGERETLSKLILIAENPQQALSWKNHLNSSGIQCSDELIMLAPEHLDRELQPTRELLMGSFSIPYHPLLCDAELEKIEQQIGTLRCS